MTDYDALLLDNDGVLVTPPPYASRAEAVRGAFREVGVADPDPDAVADVADGVTVDRLHAVCADAGVDASAFWAARERIDEASQVAAFRTGDRGLYDDVDALASLSIDAGVVSNNHHTTVGFVLEYFDLASRFDTYYGREKSIESLALKKPDPHYLECALADLDATTALFVGDKASDVVAADRAALDSALLVREDATESVSATPTHQIASLDELAGILDG